MSGEKRQKGIWCERGKGQTQRRGRWGLEEEGEGGERELWREERRSEVEVERWRRSKTRENGKRSKISVRVAA